MIDPATFTALRARAASQRLAQAVLPLYRATDGGRPESFATCTLIKRDQRLFLVTAAHAAEEFKTSKIYFGNTALGKVKEVPARSVFSAVEQAQGQSPLDVVIVPIAEITAHDFSGCEFLSEEHVDLGDRPDYANLGLSLYFMLGFPASRSQVRLFAERRHIKQNAFPLTAVPSTIAKYATSGLDPTLHLALDYNEKDVRRGGHKVAPPRLQGVSGGGMFRFDGLSDVVKLVAIAIEHRKAERIVVGTRIDVVFALIDSVTVRLGDEMFG